MHYAQNESSEVSDFAIFDRKTSSHERTFDSFGLLEDKTHSQECLASDHAK
jgi:hypothetical protein